MKAKNKSAQFIARNLVFQYGCSLPARNYVDGTAKRRLTPITANVPLVDVSDALQFDSQQLGTIILNKFGMRGIDAAKTNAYAVYQEQMDMHLANESMEEDVAEGFLEDFLSGVELIEDFAELADFLVDLPYAACFIVFF